MVGIIIKIENKMQWFQYVATCILSGYCPRSDSTN